MRNKKINIEFIRIFAIGMTIMIHVSNVYILNFPKVGNGDFLISVMYNAIARVCVPLFFMISGIFLIQEEYNRQKYVARIKRFVFILVVWSVIYYLYNHDFRVEHVGKAFVQSLFNPNMTSRHLWFMYAIIGLYIALPFIQSMCRNLTKEQENLFLILWITLSGLDSVCVPVASFITGADVSVEYPVPIINATYYLGYFVSGHILYERFKDVKADRKKSAVCILGYVLPTVVAIVVTYVVSVKNNRLFDAMTWYRSIFIVLAAFSIFIFILIHGDKFKNANILRLSKYSFGIYLIHFIFIIIMKEKVNVIGYNPIVFIPLMTLVIYVLSLASCWILNKIPIVKKIV